MDIIHFYTQNLLYITIIYALVIAALSFVVGYKIYSLYKLSNHKGLKLFSMAFFLFALSFGIQAIPNILLSMQIQLSVTIQMLFYFIITYTMSISGFYLVYSLAHKTVIKNDKWVTVIRITTLHVLAIVVAAITTVATVWGIHVLFGVLLLSLAYAVHLSYNNYSKHKKNKTAQMFFIAMILWLIGYVVNYIGAIGKETAFVSLYAKILTIIIFVILSYTVFRNTKNG